MLINFELQDPINKHFGELVALKKVEHPQLSVFQSTSHPFCPVKGASAVFGGHVLGQSVVAAGRTVPEGFVCHSSSSYFLAPGIPHVPFIYRIEAVRDGGNYMVREVKVYQVEEHDASNFDFQNEFLCYMATLSFKKPQDQSLEYGAKPNSSFDARDDEIIKMEEAPDVDAEALKALLHEASIAPQWHPIDCRKRDTRQYNAARSLLDRRIVHYFRSPFKLPRDPHLAVAMLLYISDRNSLFTLLNIQDDPHLEIKHIASLNHTFTLHMLDYESLRVDKEYIEMETWSDRAYDARGFYNGRMFTRGGELLASFVQDGVVRVRL